MQNNTELAILGRLLRKALELDPNFHGNKTVTYDFKGGNICGMVEVNGIKSIELSKLK